MEFTLNLILICCMFAIGSLFGSFFSLATYRIPRKEDITHSRSYCPNCKHKLGFFDLIPVLSYIFHGAKCKYCGDKISLRYFLLEACNGILFVILYLIFDYSIKLAVVAIVYAIIFVLIGSYVMKIKMTDQEIKQIRIKKDGSKNELNKKSGVFIAELLIALIAFITILLTIIVINRNSNSKSNEIIAKSNANNILSKNIEICLLADYDNLSSYTFTEDVSGIKYNVVTSVSRLSDSDTSKKDLVKQIEIKVSYNLNNKYYEFNMKTLKGKV